MLLLPSSSEGAIFAPGEKKNEDIFHNAILFSKVLDAEL